MKINWEAIFRAFKFGMQSGKTVSETIATEYDNLNWH